MFGIYVVSIEERNSHRILSFFEQNFFKNVQQENIFIVGVKGGGILAKEYFNLAVQGRKKPLSPGELGCTLSHLEIERKKTLDIPQTKLGKGISKELAKLQYKKFNLN